MGGLLAGGLGVVVGGKGTDVNDELTRFDIAFRSGKVAYCLGTTAEYDALRRGAAVGPGEKPLSALNRSGVAPSLSDRDRLRAQLAAEKDARKAEKSAQKLAAKQARADAKAARRAG